MNENNSYYESSVGYASESYSADCIDCGMGGGSEISGTLSTVGEVVDGNLTGTVVSAPTGGGGGGGSIVPIAQAQPLPTTTQPMQGGSGGGMFPGTTTDDFVPNMPNTALGDNNLLYLVLFMGVFIVAELSNLIYKKIYLNK